MFKNKSNTNTFSQSQSTFLKKTSLAVGFALSSLFAHAASAESLLHIYERALEQDPQLLASAANREAIEEGIIQSRAVLLPQVGASISRQESDSDNFISGEPTVGVPIPDRNFNSEVTTDTFSVRLDQQIYHHDSWVGYSQSQKRAKRAQFVYQQDAQSLIIRVSEAYFDVLAAMDSVEFSEAELKAVDQELRQTKQRFDVGLSPVTDVHEAQARRDQGQASVIQARNNLDNAYEALRTITGQYHYDLLTLKKDLPLKSPDPDSIEDWVRVAQEQNLAIMAGKLDVDIARKEIKRQFAGHLPSADLTLGYNDVERDTARSESGANSDSFDASDGTVATVRVDVPIFSGFATQSRTRQARYEFERASHNLTQTHRDVQRQVRSAYLGVKAAISSVRALEQSVTSQQSALEATQAGFEVGTRTIVDVLLSTRSLYDAKRNLARARYDYILNTLKLKQAAGILNVQDLQQVNALLR